MSVYLCWSKPQRSRELRACHLVSGLLLMSVVLSASLAYADNTRRLVEFVPGTSLALQQETIAASGSRLLKHLPLVNSTAIKLPEASAAAALDYLRSRREVKQIHLDPQVPAQTEMEGVETAEKITPPTWKPEPGSSWNLLQIALPRVRNTHPTIQGWGVEVAVIDTGIDPSHPALAGVVIGGYNAVTATGAATANSGEGGDGEGGDANRPNYVDCHGHGTHIAGIIASSTLGIAPQAKLHAVRVLDCQGGGFVSDVISGLSWVYERPQIRVVNLSLGFYKESPYPLLHQAIKALYDAGVVLVAAVGNYRADCLVADNGTRRFAINPLGCNTRVKFPARYAETITVAATEADNTIAAYSIRGPEVSIAAPGGSRGTPVISTSVWSNTVQEGASGEGGDGQGTYGGGSGTSMAAAHVTGVVALILSARPTLTPDDVRAILQSSAAGIVGLSASSQGHGRVSAHGAVSTALSWTGLPATSSQTTMKRQTSIDRSVKLGHDVTVESYSVVQAETHLMPYATLKTSATVGRKATLGAYTLIEEKARVGTNVAVGHHAKLEKSSRVGARGEDIFGAVLGDYAYIGENVVVGTNVRIGDYTVIEKDTRVGDRTTIDDYTQIKQRVVVGTDVTIGSNVLINDGAVICNGAAIPDHTTIAPWHRVGTCF